MVVHIAPMAYRQAMASQKPAQARPHFTRPHVLSCASDDLSIVLSPPAGPGLSWVASKVVATLGPSCQDVEILCQMLRAGMSVARVDLTWGGLDFHRKSLQNLNIAMKRCHKLCAIMVDTLGREIMVRRTFSEDATGWPVHSEQLTVSDGEMVILTPDPTLLDLQELMEAVEGVAAGVQPKVLPITSASLPGLVQPGDTMYVGRYLACGAPEHGSLFLHVNRATPTCIICTALTGADLGGLLTVFHLERSEHGLHNLQSDLPVLSQFDKDCLAVLATEFEIDFVGLSFTRNAADVREALDFLHAIGIADAEIIAKVETRQALFNFQEILDASHGVLISRGPLGLDVAPEKMVLVQKALVIACNLAGKPVIISRVLDSMSQQPRPTRAEATDVANIVLDGADGVLLGAETLRGKYPVQSVRMAVSISCQAEAVFDHANHYEFLMDTAMAEDVPEPAGTTPYVWGSDTRLGGTSSHHQLMGETQPHAPQPAYATPTNSRATGSHPSLLHAADGHPAPPIAPTTPAQSQLTRMLHHPAGSCAPSEATIGSQVATPPHVYTYRDHPSYGSPHELATPANILAALRAAGHPMFANGVENNRGGDSPPNAPTLPRTPASPFESAASVAAAAGGGNPTTIPLGVTVSGPNSQRVAYELADGLTTEVVRGRITPAAAAVTTPEQTAPLGFRKGQDSPAADRPSESLETSTSGEANKMPSGSGFNGARPPMVTRQDSADGSQQTSNGYMVPFSELEQAVEAILRARGLLGPSVSALPGGLSAVHEESVRAANGDGLPHGSTSSVSSMYAMRAAGIVPDPPPAPAIPAGLSKLESVTSSAVKAAEKVKASLIVVLAHCSRAPQLIAKYRPPMPILTLVVPQLVSDGLKWRLAGRSHARQCLLTRGLLPMLSAPGPSGDEVLEEAVATAARWGLVAAHQYVVVVERIHENHCVKIVAVDELGLGIKQPGSGGLSLPLMAAGSARRMPRRESFMGAAGSPMPTVRGLVPVTPMVGRTLSMMDGGLNGSSFPPYAPSNPALPANQLPPSTYSSAFYQAALGMGHNQQQQQQQPDGPAVGAGAGVTWKRMNSDNSRRDSMDSGSGRLQAAPSYRLVGDTGRPHAGPLISTMSDAYQLLGLQSQEYGSFPRTMHSGSLLRPSMDGEQSPATTTPSALPHSHWFTHPAPEEGAQTPTLDTAVGTAFRTGSGGSGRVVVAGRNGSASGRAGEMERSGSAGGGQRRINLDRNALAESPTGRTSSPLSPRGNHLQAHHGHQAHADGFGSITNLSVGDRGTPTASPSRAPALADVPEVHAEDTQEEEGEDGVHLLASQLVVPGLGLGNDMPAAGHPAGSASGSESGSEATRGGSTGTAAAVPNRLLAGCAPGCVLADEATLEACTQQPLSGCEDLTRHPSLNDLLEGNLALQCPLRPAPSLTRPAEDRPMPPLVRSMLPPSGSLAAHSASMIIPDPTVDVFEDAQSGEFSGASSQEESNSPFMHGGAPLPLARAGMSLREGTGMGTSGGYLGTSLPSQGLRLGGGGGGGGQRRGFRSPQAHHGRRAQALAQGSTPFDMAVAHNATGPGIRWAMPALQPPGTMPVVGLSTTVPLRANSGSTTDEEAVGEQQSTTQAAPAAAAAVQPVCGFPAPPASGRGDQLTSGRLVGALEPASSSLYARASGSGPLMAPSATSTNTTQAMVLEEEGMMEVEEGEELTSPMQQPAKDEKPTAEYGAE